jgi:hypothetical protein
MKMRGSSHAGDDAHLGGYRTVVSVGAVDAIADDLHPIVLALLPHGVSGAAKLGIVERT